MKADPLALLTEEGSLTELIGLLMGQTPILDCLFQGKAQASSVENQLLGVPPEGLSHIREISMGSPTQDWMFARTVIPVTTLEGQAAGLAHLGDIPIGQLLFGELKAKRLDMNLALIFAKDIPFTNDLGIERFNIPQGFTLWHRRSIFEIASGSLLINEIFLPDCPVYERN